MEEPKFPEKLPNYIAQKYLRIDKLRSEANSLEADISEWFDKNNMFMLTYDENGDYLPLLSGDGIYNQYSSRDEALESLQKAYKKHIMENETVD